MLCISLAKLIPIIGASLSEPHTSELTLKFCLFVWYVRWAAGGGGGGNSNIATDSFTGELQLRYLGWHMGCQVCE